MKIFLILLGSTSCFATSFSFGESIEINNNQALLELIMQSEKYCAENITAGKIYFNSEKIFPVGEEVFLRINHFDLIKLPSLFSDENGYFIWLTQ